MAMRKRCALTFAPLALLAAPVAAQEQNWATASDIGVGALVIYSIGAPLASGDEEGALEAGLSIAAAQGVAQLLKHVIDAPRPDRSNSRSFPSGHASTAFAAASSILERRGADEGVPAMVLAGLVGTARVEARKHHWRDVLAGAAIGSASGLLFTGPRERHMTIAAWGDTKGGGVSFSMAF